MSRLSILLTFTICAITLTASYAQSGGYPADVPGASLLTADMDIDDVMRLKESGEILPLEEVLQKVKNIQPGRVIEIELDEDDGRYIYELEIVDGDGVVWDIEIDAQNGELIERERDN